MAKTKLSPAEQVTQFIQESKHPLADVMQALRELILETDTEISEHIKWNSPAFYYNADMADFDAKEYKRDMMVYNIRKEDSILLIFPTGSVIKDAVRILEGNYADGRRMVAIKSMNDLNTKKEALQVIIKDWLSKIDK
ncbi:DUF1801 domain-containing protein [Flavobacterium hauense]